jgi:UDP-N-acetylglucosamine 2-epimerase (non-hydrolysing)
MDERLSVLAVFGTRPEIIKFSPVLNALEAQSNLRVVRLSTGQQADLAPSFLQQFKLRIDEALELMTPEQSLNQLLAKSVVALERAMNTYQPAAVIVQGDTTSALAGALSARFLRIPVIHIEAGLRSGDINSPFPEESNRKLISHLSTLHLAPTERNVATLISEGIRADSIVCTGNPIVDVLHSELASAEPDDGFDKVLDELADYRTIAVTLHRRENFGQRLDGYLNEINRFVMGNPDIAVVLPVHPNPSVQASVNTALADSERIKLVDPLSYANFICLLRSAWLVLSDSGGVQEEVVSLGKPLLILRENTERQEVIGSGYARLARSPSELHAELHTANQKGSWCTKLKTIKNPFGDGDSGARCAAAISAFLFDELHARTS